MVIAWPKQPRGTGTGRLGVGDLDARLSKEIKGQNARHQHDHRNHRVQTAEPQQPSDPTDISVFFPVSSASQ